MKERPLGLISHTWWIMLDIDRPVWLTVFESNLWRHKDYA